MDGFSYESPDGDAKAEDNWLGITMQGAWRIQVNNSQTVAATALQLSVLQSGLARSCLCQLISVPGTATSLISVPPHLGHMVNHQKVQLPGAIPLLPPPACVVWALPLVCRLP